MWNSGRQCPGNNNKEPRLVWPILDRNLHPLKPIFVLVRFWQNWIRYHTQNQCQVARACFARTSNEFCARPPKEETEAKVRAPSEKQVGQDLRDIVVWRRRGHAREAGDWGGHHGGTQQAMVRLCVASVRAVQSQQCNTCGKLQGSARLLVQWGELEGLSFLRRQGNELDRSEGKWKENRHPNLTTNRSTDKRRTEKQSSHSRRNGMNQNQDFQQVNTAHQSKKKDGFYCRIGRPTHKTRRSKGRAPRRRLEFLSGRDREWAGEDEGSIGGIDGLTLAVYDELIEITEYKKRDRDDGEDDEVDRGPSVLSVDQSAITGALAYYMWGQAWAARFAYYMYLLPEHPLIRSRATPRPNMPSSESAGQPRRLRAAGSNERDSFQIVLGGIRTTLLVVVLVFIFIVWVGGFFRHPLTQPPPCTMQVAGFSKD
ncbi:hypothetical protein B0H13DRAFT_1886571 [Mycena leptocephala]|nr:hypothetical protein B0H13DRAFT_1886571 [Mycena leptocephala]